MRERELKEWLRGLDRLTLAQRQHLRQQLDTAASRDEVAAAQRQRSCSHPGCPHCRSLSVVRNGNADGLRRGSGFRLARPARSNSPY